MLEGIQNPQNKGNTIENKRLPTELEASVLNRSVEEIFPSKDFLLKGLQSGKKLRVYMGIDPTGPTLHIGHAIVIKKLKEFQDMGHEVIMLIGDFTAMIGDPTDKMAVRKKLTEKEIKKNLSVYKKQASVFLRFSGKNKAKIKYNSKWLKKLGMKDVLELTSMMTVDQMLKRDMFSRRMEENKPIHIHEFMYPLLQGYDSVAMDVDVEIGGNDQMFNMLVGRDFQRKIRNKEKVAITVKLLADANGKKMGKTEGNMVSLSDSYFDMFGKIMSWTDGMIVPGFELCTNVSATELTNIEEGLKNGRFHPKDLKTRLAKEIVAIYHGDKKAEDAQRNFDNTFSKKEIPENIIEIKVNSGDLLGEILVDQKHLPSMAEFRRLVLAGAISDVVGEKITDPKYSVEKEVTLKVGKKNFYKIVLK